MRALATRGSGHFVRQVTNGCLVNLMKNMKNMNTTQRFFSTDLADSLPSKYKGLLVRQEESLKRIEGIINESKFEPSKNDMVIISNAKRDLRELFLVATVGEFNSGKSTFLNALLKKKILLSGVTPTTSKINFIRYGPEYKEEEINDSNGKSVKNIYIPVDWLKTINLVDSPGLNSMYQDHQEITSSFIPRCDIVFFLTSACQVFNKSEKDFIEYIRTWNKRVVLIISKKDQLESTEDLERVTSFLATNFEKEFGYKPDTFCVSSRTLLSGIDSEGKVSDQANKESGFHALSKFIVTTLNDRERIRLKFHNIMCTSEKILSQYDAMCSKLSEELDVKLSEVSSIEKVGSKYTTEMKTYLDVNYADIDRVMWDMKAKACNIIDETVVVTNFRILFNQKLFSEKFTNEVIDGINDELKKKINLMINFFSQQNDQYLENIRRDLSEKFHSVRGLDYASKIEKIRSEIMNESVGKFASDYNKVEGLSRIVEDIKTAFWSMIVVELTAIFGIGTVVQLSSMAILPFEPVVITAAGAGLGIFGLTILPWKRRKLREAMIQKSNDAAKKLKTTLDVYFQNEINQNMSRIKAVIEPHQLIVKQDKEKYGGIKNRIMSEMSEIQHMRKELPN